MKKEEKERVKMDEMTEEKKESTGMETHEETR